MKKLFSLLAFFSFISTAYADPYLGVGYSINTLNLNSTSVGGVTFQGDDFLKKQLSNINVFAGYSFKNNWSAELGYFRRSETRHVNYSAAIAPRLNFLAIASVASINYKYNMALMDQDTTNLSTRKTDNDG